MANIDDKLSISRKFLEALDIDPKAGVLVAFSGGPDSSALLTFFMDQFGKSIRVGAAYYNHKLRGGEQSQKETRHAAGICKSAGIELHQGSAKADEVTDFAKTHKISIEESARILRYAFLRSIAEVHGYAFIATGHNADDLAETLIQRFFQGSGVSGLAGIPKIAGNIIRPILEWSREDVAAYNTAQATVVFEDPSNREEHHLRNRVRHTLIPVIREIFPGYRRSLDSLARKMTLEKEFLQHHLDEQPLWDKEGEVFTIDTNAFLSLHPVERIESVRGLYDTIHAGETGTLRLPFRAFTRLIHPPALRDNYVLVRGWGYRLQVHNGKVFFEPDVVFGGEKGYFMVVKKRPGWNPGWSGSLHAAGIQVRVAAGSCSASLPVENIIFPIIVRSRREGDVIKVGSFSKELKKLYNEWNVPEQTRWKIPVCEDKTGIIAVFGSLFGFPDVKPQNNEPVISSESIVFETI